MKEHSRYLRYTGFPECAKRVWSYRKIFLKHPRRYTEKDKRIMDKIILFCKEDFLTNTLVLKDRIRDIFENSSSQDEAYKKKNKLYFEDWHKRNRHLKKIIKLIYNCSYV